MVNLLKISLANLSHKSWNTIISILMMAIGLAIVTSVYLIRSSIASRMKNNTAGVDLVVGAKGSPTQLILSSLFHIDYPTGNISYREALDLKNNPIVKTWIPLSLGDNYQGYRIVGSDSGLFRLYNARLAVGSMFIEPLQVVAGAEVARKLGLQPGNEFYSSHGLQKGDHVHEEHAFQIVGVLQSAGSVIDELLITPLESIWLLHGDHHQQNKENPQEDSLNQEQNNREGHHHEHSMHKHQQDNHDEHEEVEDDKEITSVILQFTNPIGAMQMPQYINEFTNMQAASPAFETARIFSLLGVGISVLAWIAIVLIILALISLIMVLYTNLNQNVYDLVLLRVMGARPAFLFKQVTLQGLIITLSGGMLAFLIILAGNYVLKLKINENLIMTAPSDLSFLLFAILCISIVLGFLVSAIPAIKAYHINISTTLSKV